MRATFLVTMAMAGILLGTQMAAQSADSLGSVRIPRSVMANGEPLAAGRYMLRVSKDAVTPVVGQSSTAATWVEFVQDGVVRGKELASVVAPADVKAVAKGAPPVKGSSRVQLLRGGGYLRVWINHDGTQYLVHLEVLAKTKA